MSAEKASPSVLLGVTGSIAAFRALDVVRGLRTAGYGVRVVLTRNGARFAGPVSFQTLSGEPVVTDLWEEETGRGPTHIELADRASALVVAPASADIIAKLAHGIADDALTTIALAATAPLLIAPAMNVHMYEHPATQENLEILRDRGAVIVGPGEGNLACGYRGRGRMAEPDDIVDSVVALVEDGPPPAAIDPSGRPLSVVVTAGPTREAIDAVRYLSNRSSGKMGYALAAAARDAGAEVTLVSGPVALRPPAGVRTVPVETAGEMDAAVAEVLDSADILFMAAAVADYAAADPVEGKRRRDAAEWNLRLRPTPDILAGAVSRRKPGVTIVGFAAETGDWKAAAREKLARKGVDLLVANPVDRADAGFDSPTNEVVILDARGDAEEIPLAPKPVVARAVLRRALERHFAKD